VAQPGVLLFDMCEKLENMVRTLIEAKGLDAGARWFVLVVLVGAGAGWCWGGGAGVTGIEGGMPLGLGLGLEV